MNGNLTEQQKDKIRDLEILSFGDSDLIRGYGSNLQIIYGIKFSEGVEELRGYKLK